MKGMYLRIVEKRTLKNGEIFKVDKIIWCESIKRHVITDKDGNRVETSVTIFMGCGEDAKIFVDKELKVSGDILHFFSMNEQGKTVNHFFLRSPKDTGYYK